MTPKTVTTLAFGLALVAGCQSGPDPKELDPHKSFAVVKFLFKS